MFERETHSHDRSREAWDGGRPGLAEFTVVLEDVERHYDGGRVRVDALAGVSLRVGRGESVALVGPSGCGKSTLLNLIAAVDRPDGGRIAVCGLDLERASEKELTLLRRRRIGVVFQAFHLLPNLTATENVSLPLALDGASDPARVETLLTRVGLERRLHHYPSQLSGGEEQRVAIARALVHAPSLVVADEPTGNLDSRSGAEVLALMDELRREAGVSLVLATHDREVAGRADRRIGLRDGRIVDPPGG